MRWGYELICRLHAERVQYSAGYGCDKQCFYTREMIHWVRPTSTFFHPCPIPRWTLGVPATMIHYVSRIHLCTAFLQGCARVCCGMGSILLSWQIH